MDDARRAAEVLFGAYLADAASLGFHWLYDPDAITELAGVTAVFHPPRAADFEDRKGIFVHHGKSSGDGSHYSAQMQVMHQALLATGSYDRAQYLNRFAAAFGPGGWWNGYADKATKGTLAGIVAEADPPGADDDQLPAISKLPPLMVTLKGRDWSKPVHDAVSATSNNDTARAWSKPAAAALATVLAGGSKDAVLKAGIDAADPEIAAILTESVARQSENPIEFAGELGRACPLPQALPVSFQIIARADSYAGAVEQNIRAAGDNCGRGIFIGAIAAGLFGLRDVALDWSLRLNDGRRLWAECRELAEASRSQ